MRCRFEINRANSKEEMIPEEPYLLLLCTAVCAAEKHVTPVANYKNSHRDVYPSDRLQAFKYCYLFVTYVRKKIRTGISPDVMAATLAYS